MEEDVDLTSLSSMILWDLGVGRLHIPGATSCGRTHPKPGKAGWLPQQQVSFSVDRCLVVSRSIDWLASIQERLGVQPYFSITIIRVVLLIFYLPLVMIFLPRAVEVLREGALAPTWWFWKMCVCVNREPGMPGRPTLRCFGERMFIFACYLHRNTLVFFIRYSLYNLHST